MPSRVSNEVQVSTDCWRRLKSPLFILNSIQTKATLEREREIQFFYPTFFRCFFSMASMVRLYHSFLDHEWSRWRSMTCSTDSFRSRNARKKIISVLYIYIIRWQVIVQIVNRLYFLLLLPKIQRLETMANDFIVKFNRRLIHVGPWRFFFFYIFLPSSKETCAISKLLCVPTSSAQVSTIRSQNARDTTSHLAPPNSIRDEKIFFPRDIAIGKAKRLVKHRKKHRRFRRVAVAEDRLTYR